VIISVAGEQGAAGDEPDGGAGTMRMHLGQPEERGPQAVSAGSVRTSRTNRPRIIAVVSMVERIPDPAPDR
jgi:hypothetical protein